ncbi:MAG: protein-(glutamine-N5) methyltransferase, release factor-specific [Candidatus Magasanikbacteria bacterium CG11_big_fil_rev_8_21_14_0_20_43_7]|uniref:Protein-(Glutamine-N5) methyltransferase, release factor-specific n=1 Tax=Candidatus Magasanikbacteria bacterium CG11_big_fil_rev_8_21_14_0_20_43_7 TaxID=1974654 RepID=A0A2H0N1Z3_9BACT|nr:MAG: protein-(glutamine-N5) methyltransferase, release factor-specific [Candidatus Magasanikbacteria bacterium CG11_big_fil_rev_8_21_14_0_20_43_7]
MSSVFYSSTIKKLLTSASNIIDHLDAKLILAHVLKKPREFLIAHDDLSIGVFEYWLIRRLVQKRKNGVPLAYLTGKKEFYGLEFEVNTHTLIPRPDTELMVSLTLDSLQTSDYSQPITLIDVGTGSGCIPISIAKQTIDYGLQTHFYGSDISKKALRVAKKNAKKHEVNITFKQGNLLKPWLSSVICRPSTFIITANLPYLTDEQFTSEPSIQHEPKSALVAKKNGLALYEELLKQLKQIVTGYRLQVTCFFEIDPSQSSEMQTLIHTYLPTAGVNVYKDLAENDRVVYIAIPNKTPQ